MNMMNFFSKDLLVHRHRKQIDNIAKANQVDQCSSFKTICIEMISKISSTQMDSDNQVVVSQSVALIVDLFRPYHYRHSFVF